MFKEFIIVLFYLAVVQGKSLQNTDGFIFLGSFPKSTASDVGRRVNQRVDDNFYYLHKTKASWNDALFTCRQGIGGELLSIDDRAEDDFVRDLLGRQGIDKIWTSGAHDANLGIWRWVSNGGEVLYSNWLQPPSFDATSRIAVTHSLFSYGWTTSPLTETNFYICKETGDAVPQPTPSTTTTTTTEAPCHWDPETGAPVGNCPPCCDYQGDPDCDHVDPCMWENMRKCGQAFCDDGI